MSGFARWELEVDAGAQPIQGRLRDGRGRERAFSSWIALFAALEALHREALDNGAGQPSSAPASSERPDTSSLR